jgi:hypothetical protein
LPRSTARGWLAPTTAPVFALNALNQDAIRLQREVVALPQRVDRLVALLRLLALVLKLASVSLCRVQLPEGLPKARLLQTIERARAYFAWRAVLHIIGLSHARFHAWKGELACGSPIAPAARGVRHNSSRSRKSTRGATWSLPNNTGMWLPADWLAWHSDSERSSPRPARGGDCFIFIAGDGRDIACILPNPKSVDAFLAPTKSGTSTPR